MSDRIEKHFLTANGVPLTLSSAPKQRCTPEGLTLPQLEAWLQELKATQRELDAEEPEDMDTEEHEDWAVEREALEDLMDAIRDAMDELQE